jgi:hypothetical protein
MEMEHNQFDTMTGSEKLGSVKFILLLLLITALSIGVIILLGIRDAMTLLLNY